MTDDPQRADRRRELGIPDEAAGCHTALVDGYAVEGHVPIQAIERLLSDRPDLVGIAVPAMPGDSPGMGGDESTWATVEVTGIDADGSMTPFAY